MKEVILSKKPLIRAYNGDCMEFMQNCDVKYDLAICDPPYGIGMDGQKLNIRRNPKHNRKYKVKKNWDKHTPQQIYFDLLNNISKDQILFGANYYTEKLGKTTKGWIVWDKGQRGLTQSDCEFAYTSFDRAARIFTLNRTALISQNTFHPTEKPIKLYKWILSNYAKTGDKILDTHGGSMSIAIACYDLGFDLDIIELDKEYFEKAVDRVQKHISQETLFKG